MPTFRVEKTRDYTVVNNTHIRDKRLSLKAKGLLELMLALPDEWDYSVKGLMRLCNERQSALDSALKELKDYGYLVVEKQYPNETATGRIEYIYTVYERPQKQEVEKQGIENQGVENQGVENPYLLNTNISNTKRLNTKETESKHPSVEEVREYCKERRNNVDAERFVDYYTSVGWVVGKGKKMKDWRSAVRNWERMDNERKGDKSRPNGERQYDDDFFKRLENGG